MAPGNAFLVDVGHGSAAAVVTPEGTIVIDAGPGISLLKFLRLESARTVTHALITHADADHIGGLKALLDAGDVALENIWLNPDPVKTTQSWDQFRFSVEPHERASGVITHSVLNTKDPGTLTIGGVQLSVLEPVMHLPSPPARARPVSASRC